MLFAIITNGTVTNVIEATADFAESIGAVEIPNGYGIGDKCVDGLWGYSEKLVPEPLPPEPAPPLSEVELLKAQNKALSDRLEFTEDLTAEMAMKVYAE